MPAHTIRGVAADAFFRRDGDHYVPTELTRGPWDPDSQHAGPPAGLIGREIERLDGGEGRHVARITFEILRPVPIVPLRVKTGVVRPGRSVELAEATLTDGDGDVIKARAWRLRTEAMELPAGLSSADGPGLIGSSPSTLRPGFAPPGPAEASPGSFPKTGSDVGYHTAMDYRFLQGDFSEAGPALVWMRMRHPLIAGEEPTPLQRVLVAADSGNGVSATLDWTRYLFINVELTVHLHRALDGDWVCMDAITIPEPDGVGLADTALYDERGPIGRAMQALLIDERGE
jgi:Acyl-CoA thioesterase C-terminal domain/Acyl-CoA thioesterase N-terminal domain